jgi:dTDP-D-glucose 4,6-dehydratase
MSNSKIHIPDMGSHIMLDFTNIQNFDLSDHELMINILEDGLKKTIDWYLNNKETARL